MLNSKGQSAHMAIDIGELDDLQHLLIWQKEYVFKALKRSETLRHSDEALYELYDVIHGRDIAQYVSGKDPLPFNKDCDNSNNGMLVDHDPAIKLSIVAISRNDNHVERMEDRTQAFIDCIYFLAEKYATQMELIIVEWNPPENRKSMIEQFSFPANHPYVSARIITVSRELHSRYQWAENLPVYQMIAKNAGIRRARGEYILVTNVDILLSEELFVQVTSPDIQAGRIYRSNRWDVDRSILDLVGPQEQLEQARSLHFQINYREGIYPAGQLPVPLANEDYGASLRYENSNLYRLHMEACGDFQMLHRDDWTKLRGYSELDAYSFHIDSLFALSCHHAGLEEVLLDGPHFHIDHTLGVKVRTDSYEINEKAVIKHISAATLCVIDHMQTTGKDFYQFNSEGWGLGGHILPDQTASHASWETDGVITSRTQGSKGPSSLTDLEVLAVLLDPLTVRTDLFRVWSHVVQFIEDRISGRDIYVWGGGLRGRFTAESLRSFGLTISGIIHGGGGKFVSKNDGFSIIEANMFLEKSSSDSFVVIGSIFAEDIRGLIEQHGWIEGKDYIVGI